MVNMFKKEKIKIERKKLLELGNKIETLDLSNSNKYFLNLISLNDELFILIKDLINKEEKTSFISENYNIELKMLYNEYAIKDEQGTIIDFNPNDPTYLAAIQDLNFFYKDEYKSMLDRKEMFNSWLLEEIEIEIVKLDFNYFPNIYISPIIYKYLAFNI